MDSKKFKIDYSNFDAEKEYYIKNKKVSKSNARIIADNLTKSRMENGFASKMAIAAMKVGGPSKGGKANSYESQSAKGKLSALAGGPSKGGKGNTSESQSSKNKQRKTFGHPPVTSIEVYRFDTNDYVGEYKSISECARVLKLDKGSIQKVIIGKYSQHKGYYFKKI
jgi:hypothetical protein